LAAEGIASFKICRRLPLISVPALMLTPVILPPGCARLLTNPPPTGSPAIMTMGIVVVAAANALRRGLKFATITSGARLTTSAASVARPSERSLGGIALDDEIAS